MKSQQSRICMELQQKNQDQIQLTKVHNLKVKRKP
jgi:hypothetical protein